LKSDARRLGAILAFERIIGQSVPFPSAAHCFVVEQRAGRIMIVLFLAGHGLEKKTDRNQRQIIRRI
jgi:hypothetical protein